jgi:hypothetical protein
MRNPLMAQKDKTAVTVRWAAHDDNGDDLIYSVWYRGVGERNWLLLKDKISDKFLSFDSELLPDGQLRGRRWWPATRPTTPRRMRWRASG